MRRSPLLRAVIGGVLLFLSAGAALAQPTDVQVKAEFLPRFARYVTWPAEAVPKNDSPFVLCVIGSDPFGRSLDMAARGKAIDGRRVTVRRTSAADGARGCHIAFVGSSRDHSSAQALATIGTRPVLTVTDAGNGSQRGIVHFTIVSGRVRFFIDQAAAERRGLTISSRLLALAVRVRQ